jgi:hypothetical protein
MTPATYPRETWRRVRERYRRLTRHDPFFAPVLLDNPIEFRCRERAVRARPLMRIIHARSAANAIERCLREFGWVSDDALCQRTSYVEPNSVA